MTVGVTRKISFKSYGTRSKSANLECVSLVEADFADLPFKESSFDGVTCSHAFYELPGESADHCLKGVIRVLKRERVFVMMEHDIPTNPFVRLLFYLRIFMMGRKRALEILRDAD